MIDSLHLRALIAGLMFGLYPLVLNISGFPPNRSAIFFTGIVFVFIFAYTIPSMEPAGRENMYFMLLACLFGAAGMKLYTGIVAEAAPAQIGSIAVLAIILQVSVLAIHNCVANGLSTTKLAGFVLAAVSVYLLRK